MTDTPTPPSEGRVPWACFDCGFTGHFRTKQSGIPIDRQDVDAACTDCGSTNIGDPGFTPPSEPEPRADLEALRNWRRAVFAGPLVSKEAERYLAHVDAAIAEIEASREKIDRLQRSEDDALGRLRAVVGLANGDDGPDLEEYARGDEVEAVRRLRAENEELRAERDMWKLGAEVWEQNYKDLAAPAPPAEPEETVVVRVGFILLGSGERVPACVQSRSDATGKHLDIRIPRAAVDALFQTPEVAGEVVSDGTPEPN